MGILRFVQRYEKSITSDLIPMQIQQSRVLRERADGTMTPIHLYILVISGYRSKTSHTSFCLIWILTRDF